MTGLAILYLGAVMIAAILGGELDEHVRERRAEGWDAAACVAVLLDNIPAADVAIRRAWRLARRSTGSWWRPIRRR